MTKSKIKEVSAATLRKRASRQANADLGLVRVKLPELWLKPDKARKLEKQFALMLAEIQRG